MATQGKQGKQILTPDAAFARLTKWCAQQERSQFETRVKLRGLGVSERDTESVIARLISENFLNEDRFARAFAGGKFRMKGWGRNKIKSALQMHRVSSRNIEEALKSLDESSYSKAIGITVEKKLRLLPFTDRRSRYYKTLSFAVGKGFESELVSRELNRILGDQNDDFRT
jgi:regulatory protein